ncbi:hypothetical protein FH972_022452 [Carpinus fangiana]|uniref:Major facilitator superfamily (MFS) profile domain-containing protein n=1 Tax=Carpinus fangiana TaxID=176857 RepID=A0A5N6KS99_9ROSI|nr:hypothetical protein FH972_022452 [Carpinus fangiana]
MDLGPNKSSSKPPGNFLDRDSSPVAEEVLVKSAIRAEPDASLSSSNETLSATVYCPTPSSKHLTTVEQECRFPDSESHLDIELSCLEDHPSCISFDGTETVGQARQKILETTDDVLSGSIESWTEKTSPKTVSTGKYADNVDLSSSIVPAFHHSNIPRAMMSVRRFDVTRQPQRLSPILSVPVTPSSSFHGKHQSSMQTPPPVPPKDTKAQAMVKPRNNNINLCDWAVPQGSTSRHVRTTQSIVRTIKGTMASDQTTHNVWSSFDHESNQKSTRFGNRHGRTGYRLQSWAYACAGFLTCFNTWGMAMSFGVFQAYYKQKFLVQESNFTLSWIGSTQFFLLLFMAVPTVLTMNNGFFHMAFGGGSVLHVLVLFCMSTCSSWNSLLCVQGLLFGIASGMVFSSGTVILMSSFEAKPGVAIAAAALGSCIGGICYTLMFQLLIKTLSFGWTIRCIGLVALVTLMPANAIFRQHSVQTLQLSPMRIADFTYASYLLDTAGHFLTSWGIWFGFAYMPLFGLTKLHLTTTDANNLLIFMIVANAAGCLLSGMLADRLLVSSNRSVLSCILSGMATLWWVFVDSHAGVIAVAIIYGFTSSGASTFYASREHPLASGLADLLFVRHGVMFAFSSFALLTAMPIGAALIDARAGDYLYAQIFAGCSLVSGGMLTIAARMWKN